MGAAPAAVLDWALRGWFARAAGGVVYGECFVAFGGAVARIWDLSERHASRGLWLGGRRRVDEAEAQGDVG